MNDIESKTVKLQRLFESGEVMTPFEMSERVGIQHNTAHRIMHILRHDRGMEIRKIKCEKNGVKFFRYFKAVDVSAQTELFGNGVGAAKC